MMLCKYKLIYSCTKTIDLQLKIIYILKFHTFAESLVQLYYNTELKKYFSVKHLNVQA